MCHGSHTLQEGAQELTPSCGGHQAQSALLHRGASWAPPGQCSPRLGLGFWPWRAALLRGVVNPVLCWYPSTSEARYFPDSLPYSLPPGARLADTQLGTQKPNEVASRGPSRAQGAGRKLGTKKRSTWTKAHTFPPCGDRRPRLTRVLHSSGEEFHDHLRAEKAQRHDPSPWPQQDHRRLGCTVESW